MRWPSWLVRVVVFGGIGLFLIIAIGGRFRADRALERANDVAKRGTPSEVMSKAQQAVTTWLGDSAVVISVQREDDHWRATALAGTTCYEIVVSDRVSAHPGRVACPLLDAAGTASTQLAASDPRYNVVAGFLDAWLTGDLTADRYLAADQPHARFLDENADRVKVTAVYGKEAPTASGAKSLLTSEAEVSYSSPAGDRTEHLAWTLLLVKEGDRWSIVQIAGGEIPTGDSAAMTGGVTEENR